MSGLNYMTIDSTLNNICNTCTTQLDNATTPSKIFGENPVKSLLSQRSKEKILSPPSIPMHIYSM